MFRFEQPLVLRYDQSLGLAGVLWSGCGGAVDFLLIQWRIPAYLALRANQLRIPELELVRYYDAWPLWTNTAWAMSTWGAAFASILLLCGSRNALAAFVVSLLGLIVMTYFWYYVPMPRVAGDDLAFFAEDMRFLYLCVSVIITCASIRESWQMIRWGELS